MPQPLLTIIVPTYRRSAHLDLLLHTLREETATVANDVVVLVSDNASPDDTPAVVARAAEGWPALQSHRQATNVGPERNFCCCVRAVRTRWFWIIGDDDLPKRGVLAKIVALLRTRQPALVYMQSEWLNPVQSPDQGDPVSALRIADLDALAFAHAVHIWTTYISGIVIDRERLGLSLQGHPIDRFDATSLVQLGWVLPMLNTPGPFLFISDRCVLATKDNTGGYGLLTVFGANFPRIVNDTFGPASPLSRALIDGAIAQYLPGLIWGGRQAAGRTFHIAENAWPAMNRQLGSRWLYWLLLVPLGRFPTWLAQPFFQIWRVANRLQREWDDRFGIAMKIKTGTTS